MPTKTPSHNGIRALSSGFTLVEMAVVVVVMGILLTLGLRMTQATQNNAAWAETKLKQDRIKVALIAFMRTNGRLPCPDAALPPTGAEPLPIGNCLVNAGRGVLPWQALGLSVNDVQDGWSNFFTYRVANGTPPGNRNWTLRVGATAFTLQEFVAPSAALTIRERSDLGVLSTLTTNAVVAIISHGKNGLGARTLRGAAVIPLAAAGADEVINATPAQTTFITRTPTDAAAAIGGTIDDVVTYLTPQDVLQPLVSERSLFGACASYCRPPPATCPAAPANTCNATNIPVGAATIAACPCVASLALPQ